MGAQIFSENNFDFAQMIKNQGISTGHMQFLCEMLTSYHFELQYMI